MVCREGGREEGASGRAVGGGGLFLPSPPYPPIWASGPVDIRWSPHVACRSATRSVLPGGRCKRKEGVEGARSAREHARAGAISRHRPLPPPALTHRGAHFGAAKRASALGVGARRGVRDGGEYASAHERAKGVRPGGRGRAGRRRVRARGRDGGRGRRRARADTGREAGEQGGWLWRGAGCAQDARPRAGGSRRAAAAPRGELPRIPPTAHLSLAVRGRRDRPGGAGAGDGTAHGGGGGPGGRAARGEEWSATGRQPREWRARDESRVRAASLARAGAGPACELGPSTGLGRGAAVGEGGCNEGGGGQTKGLARGGGLPFWAAAAPQRARRAASKGGAGSRAGRKGEGREGSARSAVAVALRPGRRRRRRGRRGSCAGRQARHLARRHARAHRAGDGKGGRRARAAAGGLAWRRWRWRKDAGTVGRGDGRRRRRRRRRRWRARSVRRRGGRAVCAARRVRGRRRHRGAVRRRRRPTGGGGRRAREWVLARAANARPHGAPQKPRAVRAATPAARAATRGRARERDGR